MDTYDTVKSCRIIRDFIEGLSLWYLRRSRKRFSPPEGFSGGTYKYSEKEGDDMQEACYILRFVLENFSKAIAPVLPFTAEYIFKKIKKEGGSESVHLCSWPKADKKFINEDLEEKMDEVRKLVTLALAERIVKGVKVKQPLASLKIKDEKSKIKGEEELLELIKDEVNVKNIIFDDKIEKDVELDTKITEELKEERLVREFIRNIQDARKNMGLKPENRITARVLKNDLDYILEKNKDFILRGIRANKFQIGGVPETSFDREMEIDGKKILFKVEIL
jgi:isoleucyl-tRNA synthetase